MELQKELETAKKAAREAGELVKEYRKKGAESWSKEDDSIVTEADIASQEKIIDIISSAFPEDGFFAEENEVRPDGEDRVWIIDPIDGTEVYSRGMDDYCIPIALEINGETRLGVTYVPESGELFYAIRGGGAYKDGEEIEVSDRPSLDRAIIITIPAVWEEELRDRAGKFYRDIWDADAINRKIGSAALQLCELASGKVDGYIASAINRWDTSAGALIVEEAGGEIRWQDSVIDGKKELVASNGRIQKELEDLFDRSFRR